MAKIPRYKSDEGFFLRADGSRTDEGFLPEPDAKTDYELRIVMARSFVRRGGTEEDARRLHALPASVNLRPRPVAERSSPPVAKGRKGSIHWP